MNEKIPKITNNPPSFPERTKGFNPEFSYKYSLFKLKELNEICPKAPEPTEAEVLHEKWTNINSGLSEEFFEKIEDMSKRLKCKPDDLAALIYGESRFDSKANGGGGLYRGLAQMTGASLKNCIKFAEENPSESPILNKNMKMKDFVNLSREEQLPYVEAYLHMVKDDTGLKDKKISGAQLWGLILSPNNVHNESFLDKVDVKLDSLKQIPEKFVPPEFIRRPKN